MYLVGLCIFLASSFESAVSRVFKIEINVHLLFIVSVSRSAVSYSVHTSLLCFIRRLSWLGLQVLERIASGSYGNVLKVKHTEDGQVYAMKVLRKAQLIEEGAVRQCKDEVQIQVRHASAVILQFLCYGSG